MGKLTVTLLGGKGLSAKDLNGKSDPYVKLKWGNQKFKSSVKKGTLNPQWHEKFVFDIPSHGNNPPSLLDVSVWDSDKWSSDDPMGKTMVYFDDLQQGVASERWMPLAGGRGQIGFKLLADFPPSKGSSTPACSTPVGTPMPAKPGFESGHWACPACTFSNQGRNTKCEICGTAKPGHQFGGGGSFAGAGAGGIGYPGQQQHQGIGAGYNAQQNFNNQQQPNFGGGFNSHAPHGAQMMPLGGMPQAPPAPYEHYTGMPYIAPPIGMHAAPVYNSGPVRPTGRKKALLIGINYFRSRNQLRGCINDVQNMKRLLQSYGFPTDHTSMVTLTDDQRDQHFIPTKHNIMTAMQWLVSGAQPGDCLFFHFSGHGGQQRDTSGMEEDGLDETILPCDFKEHGQITDDTIFNLMVGPLPSGVRLTAVMDCCHSGTGMDLPFTWSPRGWSCDSNPCHSMGDVQLFSGCEDNQTSADAISGGTAGGAMTSAFIGALEENPNHTYPSLMAAIHSHLRRKRYSQRPQLTSSQQFDLNKRFSLSDIVPNANPQIGRKQRRKKKKNTVALVGLGVLAGALLGDALF